MLIDSHLHIYREREIGVRAKADYPIVEYGTLEGVTYSERGGDAADALAALAEAGVSYAAVLNVFLMDGMPQPASGLTWPGADGPPPHADRAADLIGLNEWLCALAQEHAQLLPMLTVHPGVMTPAETADHVGTLASERGARGVKLHTVAQRFLPSDPALDPLWELCSDRGLPVIAHCGPDRLETGWATPEAFVPLAERFPRLPLVLAHLGGGDFRRIVAVADAFPGVRFDLSEIVSWVGGSNAPEDAAALAALVRAVGVERVMAGSDFPWYEPAWVIDAVTRLPGLSTSERDLILGRTAAQLFGL
ncbi:amidohydrolase family protein [Conexibacter sp. JD483]|uniref:amidohydrolase family protein n=1 Tax=unclassified Conexibacter TaxID=2627773 RepID=UPI00271CB03B|nr:MULTISPECIES: amidohydrolase family protein [unclassified Conexibacter]MDO8188482.1 amidohydrolase family protein [Conexibacter sp. CPCC 205706]MDO8201442.1 amidohydrolase family protein [Conexibacter sp. CPCC 205762]MDR9371748.1 amidohydrolase family protein [Conexibacter sp. JD483]